MKRQFLLLLLTLSACLLPKVYADTSITLLMPKPKNVVATRTKFPLKRPVRIIDPTNCVLLTEFFGPSDESAETTVAVNIVSAAELGLFDYQLAGFDNEGYKLSVRYSTIEITAASKTGVIRAAQTLMQLAQVTTAAEGTDIPGCEIIDYPAFKLRGFMHDVGRSFISFDELKQEIDLLSRFKVNVFHWHLTDNQGFRFESKAYPQLNKAANMTRFKGKYYTQAQCTELEAYAAERGITIIPEIDMPGHSTSFKTAMGYAMSSTQGRAALKELLSELATAFPLAPYIHMGADEAGTTAEFVNEMSKYIKEQLGRRCVVWNPISGVSISTATLPYIDMTEMWSTAGKKISGLPNIDCRYNYVNHFDVFADLVGIYKSNIYYERQGNEEVAGAITALWNDRLTPTEQDIVRQNNLYANALATAERGWMGGGRRYIEVGGTTLPGVGSEYEEFADWERRFLHYKDTWLASASIPYVKQTNVKWRITDPFPNGGSAAASFPPETATDDILPERYTYNGNTYGSTLATGAGIYLRHTWGTTVPAFYSAPSLNNTAYAWTYVYSPVAQEAGALIEFQNYGRSENDKAPDAGKWDRKGSRIWLNGEELQPPTWNNSGKSINAEVPLRNENFAAREPLSVQLNAGWNKVLLKLPYVSADGVRLNKWLFTFVLTTPDGRQALDGLIYSPSQNPEADQQAEQDAYDDKQNVVRIVYDNTKETELGTWDNASARRIWTSATPANPIAGLTLTKSAGTFDRYTGWNGYYNLAYKVGAANRNEVITLTAPSGYLIQSYAFQVQEFSKGTAANHFTITAPDGTTIRPAYGGADGYTPFSIDNINAESASFKVRSTSTSDYLAIINFTVRLADKATVGIRGMDNGKWGMGSITSYTLSGQRTNGSVARRGVYVRGGKKVIVR